jgi:hypothetical protein
MSLDRNASDRTFDRQLAYLGLLDDAAPLFHNGSSVPAVGANERALGAGGSADRALTGHGLRQGEVTPGAAAGRGLDCSRSGELVESALSSAPGIASAYPLASEPIHVHDECNRHGDPIRECQGRNDSAYHTPRKRVGDAIAEFDGMQTSDGATLISPQRVVDEGRSLAPRTNATCFFIMPQENHIHVDAGFNCL